ncbi:hypothetical protein RKK48_002695 [Vibrio cholerae]|nr:hypothetical protein [Vibrio cholerae]
MSLFFLTYDLRKSKNYDSLYKELDSFKAVRILESTWCFNRFNTNAERLREYFRSFIDSDDGLIVSEVSDWASFNTNETPNQLR